MKHPISPTTKVAVVDLDGTLVRGSINLMLVKQEARGLAAMKLMGKLMAPQGGDTDLAKKLIHAGSALFAGKTEAELLPRLKLILDKVRAETFTEMKQRIAAHQAAGTQVWLAGPVPQQLIDLMASELGATRAFGVRVKIDAGGTITEEPIEPIAYAEGKCELVLAALAEEGIDPKDTCYYADAISDLPLLESVSDPVCTNPAKKLLATAKERGWPVETYASVVG